ncbi:MAG TPA: Clp1/GlmU family protein [Elusimicrobiota bacterium]|nr:Clp1/GlmU family protein [Elusimicrobiota bacterium]
MTENKQTVSLEKQTFHLVVGPASFRLVEGGPVEVIGKALTTKETTRVPEGKKMPLEVKGAAKIELSLDGAGKIEPLEARTIPASWDKIVDEIIKRKAKLISILGDVDVGKTFFSTYLSNRLLANGRKAAVLDADIGQSDVGPPGTLGLAMLHEPVLFLSQAVPSDIYYVGAHSPNLHFLQTMSGTKRLIERAFQRGADHLIWNTPGWVAGDGGRDLRKSELEMMWPDAVILMQRKGEVEHLVRTFPHDRVIRLEVSKQASPTSADVRRKLREAISVDYFKNRRLLVLPFDQIKTDRAFILTGQQVETKDVRTLYAERLPLWEGLQVVVKEPLTAADVDKLKKEHNVFRVKQVLAGSEKGAEVGLCDDNLDCLALGIVQRIDLEGKYIECWTPLPVGKEDKVKVVQFGSLRLAFDGREAGFVEPGYL